MAPQPNRFGQDNSQSSSGSGSSAEATGTSTAADPTTSAPSLSVSTSISQPSDNGSSDTQTPNPSSHLASIMASAVAQSVNSNMTPSPSLSTIPSAALSSTLSHGTSILSQSNKSSHDLTSKAAAGIGIGGAAGGAIIALLLAFIIFRCCNRRRNRQLVRHESETALTGSQAQLFHPAYLPVPMVPVSLEKTAATLTDGAETLSPGTDNALFASWANLRDRIQGHVKGMYHSRRVESGTVSLESFEQLGYTRAQPSAPELLDRLMQPTYRADALTYLVSWCIVQRIDFHGSRWTTLLPPECVESLVAMAAGSAPTGNASCGFYRSGDIYDSNLRRIASLNHWRVCTAALLSKTYVENGFTRDDPRTAHIEVALKALMPILKPFVEEGKGTTCFEDLEDILEAAARFGFRLFANPAEYEFDWNENQWFERGELTSFPELRRINDSRRPKIGLAL